MRKKSGNPRLHNQHWQWKRIQTILLDHDNEEMSSTKFALLIKETHL